MRCTSRDTWAVLGVCLAIAEQLKRAQEGHTAEMEPGVLGWSHRPKANAFLPLVCAEGI